MLKTHNVTGLKYLCMTKRANWEDYEGSGKHWRGHLNKHGHDFSTELLFETDDYDRCVEKGAYYSELWNVVENPEFANLIPEHGYSGGLEHGLTNFDWWRKHRTEEQKQAQIHKAAKKNKENWAKNGHPFRTRFWDVIDRETKEATWSKIQDGMKRLLENTEEREDRTIRLRKGLDAWHTSTVWLESSCKNYITVAYIDSEKHRILKSLGWLATTKRSLKTLHLQEQIYIPTKIGADLIYNLETKEFILDTDRQSMKRMVAKLGHNLL